MQLFSGADPAEKYQWSKAGLIKIAKVLGWTVASTIVAFVIASMQNLDIPSQYVFLVPIINTVLFSLQNFVKKEKESVE